MPTLKEIAKTFLFGLVFVLVVGGFITLMFTYHWLAIAIGAVLGVFTVGAMIRGTFEV